MRVRVFGSRLAYQWAWPNPFHRLLWIAIEVPPLYIPDPKLQKSDQISLKIRLKSDQILFFSRTKSKKNRRKTGLLVIRQLHKNFIYQTETDATTAQLVSC